MEPAWVSIDLSQVPDKPMASPSPPAGTEASESVSVSDRGSVPAVPESGAIVEGESARRQKVVSEVRSAENAARQELADRLAESLINDVRRREQEEFDKLGDDRRKALSVAFERSRAQFEAYSRSRYPIYLKERLLELHPTSASTLARDTGILARRRKEAAELRKKLASLDAAYDADFFAAFNQVSDEYEAAAGLLREQMNKARADARAKADAEAEKTVRSELSGLNRLTTPAHVVRTKPTPAASASVSAQVLAGPPLDVAVHKSGEEAAKIEAEIWASLHGVKVSFDGRHPDRTKDFLEWLKQQDGR